MKKIGTIAIAITVTSLLSCNNNDSTKISTEKSSNTKSNDLYFDYTIDGKEMHFDTDDILTSYTESTDTSLIIFAGKEGGSQLPLVIPHLISKPSTTPSGSNDPASPIKQGSINLTDYPEKGYNSSNHLFFDQKKTPIIPDAILIISSEKQGEEATILTGTFNTKTYSNNRENDPKSTDHIVKGKFRIKHKTADSHLFNATKTP